MVTTDSYSEIRIFKALSWLHYFMKTRRVFGFSSVLWIGFSGVIGHVAWCCCRHMSGPILYCLIKGFAGNFGIIKGFEYIIVILYYTFYSNIILSRILQMATPTLAGNAALVRQFFREGWYVLTQYC